MTPQEEVDKLYEQFAEVIQCCEGTGTWKDDETAHNESVIEASRICVDNILNNIIVHSEEARLRKVHYEEVKELLS
jgi:hypothetical protein